ncbi:GNAT family N-acetyltransferase [Vibrio splendidus]|uniref:GNAT family N-acetyltransferase n=1 Tax=Vibrio splendidus TaxID=29497 RepID=UPI000769FE21|nr:GNAT family N-acetyltransferase [Vibrio splendidus]
MSIDDSIQIIDIDDSNGLSVYFDSIAELFLESFGKSLDKKLWEWAYLHNPSGEPLVSLAISHNKVIGHYAVIPCVLTNSKSTIQGYLSMTTMVSSSYRRHRLFQTLAERVFDRIKSRSCPSVVFGFPNNNSAPGFKKRLGWTVDENYKVIVLTQSIQEFWRNRVLEESFDDKFTLKLEGKIKEWRTNKPNQQWAIDQGVGLKYMNNESDLMYVETPSFISELNTHNKTYAILPIPDSKEAELNCEIAFTYRFGYRLFNCEAIEQPDFFVQMCMSDVF